MEQWLYRPMGWGLACSTCYSFSIWWHGEASQELGVQSADVSALPGALPQSSKSPASYQSPWITEVRRSVAVLQLPSWIPFHVLHSKLILLELTTSLVPGPLLLFASVTLKFLHYFLCIEDIKCYLVFFFFWGGSLPILIPPLCAFALSCDQSPSPLLYLPLI
jgi:hypothetical protein